MKTYIETKMTINGGFFLMIGVKLMRLCMWFFGKITYYEVYQDGKLISRKTILDALKEYIAGNLNSEDKLI